MKVLWITYILFPEAESLITQKDTIRKSSGGWLFGAAEALVETGKVELRVASVTRAASSYSFQRGKNINYDLIPYHKGVYYYHHDYDDYWRSITAEFKPDVVHIHGLESSLVLSYVRACGNSNVIASIQGLAGVIERYYFEGLSVSDIIRNITLGDILRRKTIFQNRYNFLKIGKMEEAAFHELNHVIGRTKWDHDHTIAINPSLEYHFCNETLRSDFYEGQWCYENCRKHTIFLSSSSTPFKGAHFVLKALPIVLRKYPDAQIRIAGPNNIFPQSLRERVMQTGYEHYLSQLIKELDIKSHVFFLGPLSSEEMKEEYLKSNVFVCPSTIENSSNSVAEAQMLGVPLIATFVGGIPDMIPANQKNSLVRCCEFEMIAQKICECFGNVASYTNESVRLLAHRRHDKLQNALQTINIYSKIAK